MLTAKRQCWIVTGVTGEGGGQVVWPVRVFLRLEEAEVFVAMANDWLKNWRIAGSSGMWERFESKWVSPEWDPDLKVDPLTGATYTVSVALPLVGDEPGESSC